MGTRHRATRCCLPQGLTQGHPSQVNAYRWLATYQDGLHAHRRSPIQVLTWADIEQLLWLIPMRYRYVTCWCGLSHCWPKCTDDEQLVMWVWSVLELTCNSLAYLSTRSHLPEQVGNRRSDSSSNRWLVSTFVFVTLIWLWM